MKEPLSVEQILEIGRTYGRTKGASELAIELGVSKQRVEQVATRLRHDGVPIPKMRLVKYAPLVEQLKRELTNLT